MFAALIIFFCFFQLKMFPRKTIFEIFSTFLLHFFTFLFTFYKINILLKYFFKNNIDEFLSWILFRRHSFKKKKQKKNKKFPWKLSKNFCRKKFLQKSSKHFCRTSWKITTGDFFSIFSRSFFKPRVSFDKNYLMLIEIIKEPNKIYF